MAVHITGHITGRIAGPVIELRGLARTYPGPPPVPALRPADLVIEAGDYVGEMSLIDNEAHSATVRCEVQTDMLILGRADFARCLPENSTLSYAILRGLVRRLRHADRQIESLALLDVYGRRRRRDHCRRLWGLVVLDGFLRRLGARAVGAAA